MLSLTFHTHAHSRGAGTRGKSAPLGREGLTTRQSRKERYYNKKNYTREEKERDTRAKIPKGKVRAPAKKTP
jgi:hypothetical protein